VTGTTGAEFQIALLGVHRPANFIL